MMHLLLTWLLAPLVLVRSLLEPAPKGPRHILLIQTAKIGDYVCTTPIIEMLRAEYPEGRISLLTHPVVEPLARCQPGVERVFTLPDGRIRGWSGRCSLYRLVRRERFDTTICVSPNLTFLLIPFLAGVQHRASVLPNFDTRSYRLAAPFLSVAERHCEGRMTIETALALLKKLGVNRPLPAKRIEPRPDSNRWISERFPMLSSGTWIGLGISSGNKLKELGKNRLFNLIEHILTLAPNIRIVLVGSNADRPLAKELMSSVPATARILDTAGQIPLDRLAALIDRFSLYVGVDSGVTYLADARGIPVIDIMGPADPEDQRPTGEHARIIRTELPCAPCSHAFLAPYDCKIGTRACVTHVDTASIINAISHIIRA